MSPVRTRGGPARLVISLGGLVALSVVAVVTWATQHDTGLGTTTPSSSTRTVNLGGLLVDVPHDCAAYAGNLPRHTPRCVVHETDDLSTYRPRQDRLYDDVATASWEGDIAAAGRYVQVSARTSDEALDILGSVRLPGEPSPELGAWQQRSIGRVFYLVPGLATTYVVARPVGRPRATTFAVRTASGAWRAVFVQGVDRLVVTAPTEALADLIAGTAFVPGG